MIGCRSSGRAGNYTPTTTASTARPLAGPRFGAATSWRCGRSGRLSLLSLPVLPQARRSPSSVPRRVSIQRDAIEVCSRRSLRKRDKGGPPACRPYGSPSRRSPSRSLGSASRREHTGGDDERWRLPVRIAWVSSELVDGHGRLHRARGHLVMAWSVPCLFAGDRCRQRRDDGFLARTNPAPISPRSPRARRLLMWVQVEERGESAQRGQRWNPDDVVEEHMRRVERRACEARGHGKPGSCRRPHRCAVPARSDRISPASEASTKLKGTTSFWLVASFPDRVIVVAVNADRVGQGGTA